MIWEIIKYIYEQKSMIAYTKPKYTSPSLLFFRIFNILHQN